MAGNTLRQQVGGFYVTTNRYIRWLNNKPLFAGTIAAAVILVCGVSAGGGSRSCLRGKQTNDCGRGKNLL